MYFEIENIGAIKHANIELGKLTVICGKNNTGKTYITYSIYGFLQTVIEQSDDLNSLDSIASLNQLYTEKLKEVFSANVDEFADAKFSVNLSDSKQNHREALIKNTFRPFILPAERIGIQLFQKELDKNKSDLVKALTKTRRLALLEDHVARLALPLEDNIDFARNYANVIKSNSFLKLEKPVLITYLEDMLGVQYQIINGQKVVIDKITQKGLPYYMSSASVRALFDLHLWIKHLVKKGDILLMDEPELNLHPENQMKIARLLVELVNSGINVFITTHSDYIIKEFNNLLMLANNFPEKDIFMKKFDYTQDDVLHPEDFKAYIAHADGTVSLADVDEYGMIQSSFDDIIVQINEKSNQLISAIDKLLAI